MVRPVRLWGAAAALATSLSVTTAAAQSAYRTLQPAGSGPFPAVMLVSGCSGFVAAGGINTFDEKAEQLRRDGWYVVFVDYLKRAGVKDCASGLNPARAAAELLTAAAWLRTQSAVDPRRISAVGWSYGGGVILDALSTMSTDRPVFSKGVLIYPLCPIAAKAPAYVPMLMLLAGKDTVAPPAACQKVSALLPAGMLEVVTYPDALHGFDQRGLPEKTQYAFGTVGYSATADHMAWQQIKAFLQK